MLERIVAALGISSGIIATGGLVAYALVRWYQRAEKEFY